jgi:GPH family glycoside/pentoside/hexuronide:cation symporter
VGGLLVAVSFVAIWWIPDGARVRSIFISDASFEWFQLAYILGGLLVFYTACTIFEIPHGALGMELSGDYHERTRLFSAKSFLGNLFAMGTPWLLTLAALPFFCGSSGNLAYGMRYVSLGVAAIVAPLSVWWFFTLREPTSDRLQSQRRTSFWEEMTRTLTNRVFLRLTIAIFALKMGFDFVSNFSNYITIFYVYGADEKPATVLLGWNGTIWAVVGVVAVFPLNWLSRRLGKNRSLLLAVLLMCAAQLSKIVCYNPAAPELLIIPTAILSMGMLMFFTLAASMMADVVDLDELTAGRRADGTYYAAFWWILKTGGALASFVGGALMVYTQFDAKQNVEVGRLLGPVRSLAAEADKWLETPPSLEARKTRIDEAVREIEKQLDVVERQQAGRASAKGIDQEHVKLLAQLADDANDQTKVLARNANQLAASPPALLDAVLDLDRTVIGLKAQSPRTLFRLRVVEIGLPIFLSFVTVAMLAGYPLTEERCYEIKAELDSRKQAPPRAVDEVRPPA